MCMLQLPFTRDLVFNAFVYLSKIESAGMTNLFITQHVTVVAFYFHSVVFGMHISYRHSIEGKYRYCIRLCDQHLSNVHTL